MQCEILTSLFRRIIYLVCYPHDKCIKVKIQVPTDVEYINIRNCFKLTHTHWRRKMFISVH